MTAGRTDVRATARSRVRILTGGLAGLGLAATLSIGGVVPAYAEDTTLPAEAATTDGATSTSGAEDTTDGTTATDVRGWAVPTLRWR